MADQVSPWLSSDDVADVLKLTPWTVGDTLPPGVERLRRATAAYVESRRRDLVTVDEAGALFTPPADVVEGALLLLARLHARKGSPQGLASFGEFGVAGVLRTDPDVERLLGLGRYGKPVAM